MPLPLNKTKRCFIFLETVQKNHKSEEIAVSSEHLNKYSDVASVHTGVLILKEVVYLAGAVLCFKG